MIRLHVHINYALQIIFRRLLGASNILDNRQMTVNWISKVQI